MGLSPELDAVLFEEDEFALGGGDDVDVGGEGVGELLVDAVGHVRVVVAGQDDDGSSDGFHELSGDLDVGLLDADVVEEVAGDGDDIYVGLDAELEHVLEGLERGLEEFCTVLVGLPGLRGVGAEMNVGGVEHAQRANLRGCVREAGSRWINISTHAAHTSPTPLPRGAMLVAE